MPRQLKKNLADILSSAIAFNKALIWDENSTNLYLATTVRELIEVFKLRSEVYKDLGYNSEFPDIIEGLNFDDYDRCSAILYTKVNGTITGTCRVIFDSDQKLPIDSYFSLNYLREQHKNIVELSRLVVKKQHNGLSQEFKLLFKGVYLISTHNNITKTISVIKNDHYKLYQKFGDVKIEKQFDLYGTLNNKFIITLWNLAEISNFFRKAFLAN